MFSFKQVNVSIGCCVEENNLFYLDDLGVLFKNEVRIFQFSVDKDDYSLCLVLDYIVIDNRYGKVVIFDIINKGVRLQNSIDECELYTGNFVSFYSPTAIGISKVLAAESQEFAYDFVADSYLLLPNSFSFADEKCYFLRKKNTSKIFTVFGYRKNNPNEVWEYDGFREYETSSIREKKVESVREILGLAENLLWVHLTSDRIVGLCPETGECIKNIEFDAVDSSDFKPHPEEFKHIVTNWGYMFVPEESKIVSLPRGLYTEIDLTASAPVRKCFNTEKSFIAAGIDCSGDMICHGKMIYFCDVMSTKVGAFDRDKKELVWHDDLKNHHEKAGVPSKIMATDAHVYFHDSNKNLFVFKKNNG